MKKYNIANYRIELIKEETAQPVVVVSCAADVVKVTREVMVSDREMFLGLLLNTKNYITGKYVVGVGVVDAALLHPREVFKAAILANATRIILVHNHPSGDCDPSQQDQDVTARLKAAGELLGIAVLDHIIVSPQGDFFSFMESGLLGKLNPKNA